MTISSWTNLEEYQEFINSIPVGWKHRVKDRVSPRNFYTHPRSGDTHWVEFVEPEGKPPYLIYCSSCGSDGSVLKNVSEL